MKKLKLIYQIPLFIIVTVILIIIGVTLDIMEICGLGEKNENRDIHRRS